MSGDTTTRAHGTAAVEKSPAARRAGARRARDASALRKSVTLRWQVGREKEPCNSGLEVGVIATLARR